MEILFKKLREGARAPTRATAGAAAADLYAVGDDVVIPSGAIATIATGIAIEIPSDNYVALLFARSGLAIKSGLSLANGVGVIDSDYRGEICVGLINSSDKAYTVKGGERIAQLAIMPVVLFDCVEASELSCTKRGEGGLGSTGKA